jgi:hypothetical protein
VKRAAPRVVLALCLLCGGTSAWADSLVLVTSEESPITSLDVLSVRKIFIGLSVSVDEKPIRPLINDTESAMRTAFLQHVVGLSEQMYRRRTLSLVMQQGRAAPATFKSQDELVRELRSDPLSVTYMWQSTASTLRRIKVIRVLWHD